MSSNTKKSTATSKGASPGRPKGAASPKSPVKPKAGQQDSRKGSKKSTASSSTKDSEKVKDKESKKSSATSSSKDSERTTSRKSEPSMEVLYTAKDPRFPTYVIIDGLYLPIDVDEKSLRFALSYRPAKDDIVIISYPKCGGVWVSQIVYLLLNDCEPISDSASFNQAMPNLEEYGYLLLKERPAGTEQRIIRTHLPYHKMRINPMAKYIYVTRNPKDCCVALYQYTKAADAIFRFKQGTFDHFFEWFIRGRVCYNDFFDHIIPYWLHRKDCHVLFCTYENMTLDHKSNIFVLANFVGGVAGTMVKDRHMLKKLIHRSSYSYMSQFYKEDDHLGNLSRGRIGEWKHTLSPAQNTRIDKKFNARFGNSEIANLWKYIVRFEKPGTTASEEQL